MTDDIQESIEDSYEDYLNDEMGYAYNAWDIVTLEDMRRHDTLRHRSRAALQGTTDDNEATNDLFKWALARAYEKHSMFDEFFVLTEAIVQPPFEHPALVYSEISEYLFEVYATHDRFEDAHRIVEYFSDTWPELTMETKQLRGRLALYRGDIEAAGDIFQQLSDAFPDDAELYFEIAEDFMARGYRDEALEWVKRSGEVAQRTEDSALFVDIQLLLHAIDPAIAKQTEL